jgi:prophage regulatory protein
MDVKLLRMKQLLKEIPVSKSTIYQWVKDGKFPKPTLYSSRLAAWKESDVRAWIEQV